MSEKKTPTETDVIELVLKEAQAYTSMDLIESYISEGKSLAQLPVQPLYVTMRQLPLEMRTHSLPLLSQEQRTVFYDLDLWKKDKLDTPEFEQWVVAVAKCPDDRIRLEFAQSPEFLLFLKGRFNIWTFDLEEPLYPDHDYYFITEDDQLLFEYDDKCDVVDEVKQIIKDVYTEIGVERGYQHFFKIVSECFMTFSEEEYSLKKGRLADYGFVDYFESLKLVNPLPSVGHVDVFIAKKEKIKANIDDLGKAQTLHHNSLVAFQGEREDISHELAKVSEQDRFHYLHFNFIRLLNGNMEFSGVLKDGPVAMTRVGKKVRHLINLGLSYAKDKRGFADESIFDYFDFADIYQIGNSLVSIIQKRVKKELSNFEMDEFDDKFLGSYFEQILDDLFNYQIQIRDHKGEAVAVNDVESWQKLNFQSNLLVATLPFIKSFKDAYLMLTGEGKLSDTFYLNYDTASIDFEAIIISSFVNFSLGKFGHEDAQKMGVTINELREFSSKYMAEMKFTEEINPQITGFTEAFGLAEVNGIEDYISYILIQQLEDYDYGTLSDEEFKHVGGPIIFNTLS
ncbi:MAG: hypothetical protein BM556_00745 [Bacteriovorax sp. MedPE-SWde]|nr:MAG: hypothetical protein BM556_00745 [Bacteriovorax sp. MedPE-SWde]